MNNTNIQHNSNHEDQEIDLIEMTRKLWVARKKIVKITCYFIAAGLLIAIFSSKEYTASCEFVPQTSKSSASSSNMARLASLAGINMGNMAAGEMVLSPMVYPNILNSTAFKRDLLQTKINIKDEPEAITLLAYLSEKQYQNFSPVNFALKYTIGLPSLIMKAIKGDPDNNNEEQMRLATDNQIILLTSQEKKAIRRLKDIILITIEEKSGFIAISANMPEPYAAAQVAKSSLRLLQEYITTFKIDKVQNNLEFIQGRYDELKKEYEEVQIARARFRDANMNTSTSRARSEIERLDNQYSLAYNVFSEIATQLEQAKIQVKETTPILTVINPVAVPIKASKPRRLLILIGFTVLGIMYSSGYVLFSPAVHECFRSARKKEEEEVA